MKTRVKRCLLIIAFLISVISSVRSVQGQVENKNLIYCESLKNLLAELSLKNLTNLEKNVGIMTSGKPAYTVIVVTPGNRKDSNAKTAQKLIRNINFLNKENLPGALRPVIVETKSRKGKGRFQIYFFDEIHDFAFDEGTFECP